MSDRTIRIIAGIGLVWGFAGGWEILGQLWPPLDVLTKDGATVALCLVLLATTRKS